MNKDFSEIPPQDLLVKNFNLWDKVWLLLTCGDYALGDFNCMTVSWGSLGVLWNKPVAIVVVRPTRYTYKFLNSYSTFSLCAFPDQFKPALNLLGTTSGKDGNKVTASGLSPIASKTIQAPIYQEAELAFECHKIYWEDLNPQHFLLPEIEKNYLEHDYHRMVIGEIKTIQGNIKMFSGA